MTTAGTANVHLDDDGELARAAAGGNSVAFGAIYDRYADRLFDFCVGMLRDREAAADCVQDVFVTAATKLPLLREPERLRSWLYAIARHEAIARLNARRREELTDTMPDQPSAEPSTEAMAVRHELADLIEQACGGLTDRDRTVMELTYRHGLDGPELADALGVSHTNANTLVGRLRENIQRSLGALLVARHTVADPQTCPTLAEILHGWDGQLTVLMRKRIARHIDACTECEADRRERVNPLALLGGAPLFIPAPKWLREHVVKLCAFGASMAAVASANGVFGGATTTGLADDTYHESGWPPVDFDTSDLEDEDDDDPPLALLYGGGEPGRRTGSLTIVLLITLLLLVGAGAALIGNFRSSPAVTPIDSTAPLPPPSTTVSTTPSARLTVTSTTTAPKVVATTVAPPRRSATAPPPAPAPTPRTGDYAPAPPPQPTASAPVVRRPVTSTAPVTTFAPVMPSMPSSVVVPGSNGSGNPSPPKKNRFGSHLGNPNTDSSG